MVGLAVVSVCLKCTWFGGGLSLYPLKEIERKNSDGVTKESSKSVNLKSLKNLIARKGMCRWARFSPERMRFCRFSNLWCNMCMSGSALQEAC